MTRVSYALIFLGVILSSATAFAQVSVDPLTGTGSMVIPIYTVHSGQVSLPISLSYTANGVKPKDVEGTAGIGWQLNIGGQVSRVVRGLPDDCTKDNSNNQRLGWMSSLDTAANSIGSFTIQNNGSTCSYETADISYINSNFPYRNDTEPDMFYVSAPGLSCQLVYDRASGKFKPVAYQDLVISYGTDPTSHLINSFTITNDKGVTYGFGNTSDATPAYNKVTRTTLGTSPSYFKNQFWQYQHGITYYDTWSLQTITDANGNGVEIDHTTPAPSRGSMDSLSVYIGGSSTATTQFYVSQSSTPFRITGVRVFNNYAISGSYFTFSWTTSTTGQTIISSISGMGHTFNFGYSGVKYSPTNYIRSFLRSFSDPGCSTPVNYQFSYAGETLSGGNYTTTLPDSTQNTFDYWGYYSTIPSGSSRIPAVYVNPSNTSYPRYSIFGDEVNYPVQLSGVFRIVDTTNIKAGSLTKISYATGGNTNIVYEANDYLDVPSGTVVKGGGIRVRQVIDSVGVHSTNNIVRNYSYLNPSSGLSSGEPISLPQYAFTIPYNGTGGWSNQTVLSRHDLSGEDNTIMYAYCKMSQTGAGYTRYQYNIPASYWDASAAPSCSGCSTEWHPTVDLVGRTNCTFTYNPVINYVYSYPFLPNPNYDFERGLPVKVTAYNDSGTEVSESNYTYSRSFTPTAITAFKNEDNPGAGVDVLSYNKYTIYYNTSELTTKVVSKVFDSQNLTQSHADSVTYTYGSSNHKLVTQQQTTNSDGSTLTSHVNYTKDYTAASGSNANVTAIYNMQQKNINVPVETYNQLTMGGTTKTTGAGLTLFRDTTISSTIYCLPSQQFNWVQTGSASFTPMTISGQTLTKDGGYFGTVNYDIYDKTGLPLTVDDTHKNLGTTLVNHFAGPIAVFKNAAYNQVAYADFDGDMTSTPYGFTITGTGSYTPVGSHAGNAAGIASTQTVTTTGTLSKNSLAQNYIFSIWVNAATAGTLTLTLTGISTHPTISYGTSGWTYYEVKIPVGTLSSSFTVSFTASNSISIDDILFYPDVASAATITYDATAYYKLAATNTNGISTYFVNDQWGRTLYTLDQDHNIVQKNTFITPADVNTELTTPTMSSGGTVYNAMPATFTISGPNPCAAAGTTVQWNFGDGTVVNAAGLISPTHKFYSLNTTKTVTATITSALFSPTKTITQNVTPLTYSIPITYTNYTTSGGNISSVTFTPTVSGSSYSFTGSNLNGGHVNQNSYTITVTVSGGQHYNSGTGVGYNCVVLIIDGNNIACANWVSTNTYTFTLDLSNYTNLNFTVSQFDCSHFIGPQ